VRLIAALFLDPLGVFYFTFFLNEQKALWFSKINRMSFSKSFVFRMTYHFIFFPLILLKLKEPRFHFFEESEIHEIHI